MNDKYIHRLQVLYLKTDMTSPVHSRPLLTDSCILQNDVTNNFDIV